MNSITYYGSVTETGILNIPHRKRLQDELRQFKGSSVTITIKKKNTRSNKQNAFLWGVVYKEIELELKRLGNDVTPEEIHEMCKESFNSIDIVGPGGEIIGKKGGSTAKMNKDEMSVYWDKIILWTATYLEITIPLPESDLQLQF